MMMEQRTTNELLNQLENGGGNTSWEAAYALMLIAVVTPEEGSMDVKMGHE